MRYPRMKKALQIYRGRRDKKGDKIRDMDRTKESESGCSLGLIVKL